jgi:hypothetical protein
LTSLAAFTLVLAFAVDFGIDTGAAAVDTGFFGAAARVRGFAGAAAGFFATALLMTRLAVTGAAGLATTGAVAVGDFLSVAMRRSFASE